MGSFVHCNVQYFYFYFLMNHCNDFAPCGLSIGQYFFYSYSYTIQRQVKQDHPQQLLLIDITAESYLFSVRNMSFSKYLPCIYPHPFLKPPPPEGLFVCFIRTVQPLDPFLKDCILQN